MAWLYLCQREYRPRWIVSSFPTHRIISDRLGLEGLIEFKKDVHTFDPEDYAITLPTENGNVTVSVFDKVSVAISIEKDKSTQRAKVKMELVKPVNSSSL